MAEGFAISDGGAICPEKFTIRLNGLLVRDAGQLPLLFDTRAEAQAVLDQLEADRNGRQSEDT